MHTIDQTLYEKYVIPQHMWDGLNMWFDYHREPGGFLQSVLKNDLINAALHGDTINRACLHNYVLFLVNEAPEPSYGSAEKYLAWINASK